jgi:regulator of CtrA degradation
MAISSKINQNSEEISGVAVSLGERIASSQSFKDLFQDGMALVERAAFYLETDGRLQSQTLERHLGLAYTTESMRLTTRLMHIAAWLLYQRAVNEGEISLEAAVEEKSKFQFSAQDLSSTGALFADLPPELQEICLHSLRIQHRIQHLDLLLSNDVQTQRVSERPVDTLQQHLRQAFQSLNKS